MKTKLPYGDWLNLMADALGFPREEFKAMSVNDRRDLLATAAGMPWGQFINLPNSVAQVEAIEKTSGKATVKDGGIASQSFKKKADGGEAEVTAKGSGSDNSKKEKTGDKVISQGGGDGDNGGEAEGETEASGEGGAEGRPGGKGGEAQGNGRGEGAGEAEGEGEGAPQEDDPTVTLGGLTSWLSPIVEKLVEERLKGFQPPEASGGGGSVSRVKITLPDLSERTIEGHVHPKFEHVLKLAALGLPIMLVGPAGTGKTTLGAQVAKALGRPFGSLSCTAGMSEGEIVGKLLPGADGGFRYHHSQFVTLYEGGGVFLFDEIDAADPNVLLKVNQSIGSVQGGGRWFNDLRSQKPEVNQHKDFVLIAAANTFGTGAGAQYVGRNQLDAATLDRFEVVEIDYDKDFEAAVGDDEVVRWLWDVRTKTQAAKLRRVVSTRSVQRATMKKDAGWSLDQIKADFFASWSRDEVAKVSVVA